MDLVTLETLLTSLEDAFEASFKAHSKSISIKNVVLRDALKNQIELKLEFEQFKSAADYYEKQAEAVKDQYHSFAFTQLMTKNNKLYNGTEANRMADCDVDYIKAVKVYNKAYKLRRAIDAIRDTIIERNFTLKDIVACVNNGTADHIL